jgi:hypothetical protein
LSTYLYVHESVGRNIDLLVLFDLEAGMLDEAELGRNGTKLQWCCFFLTVCSGAVDRSVDPASVNSKTLNTKWG